MMVVGPARKLAIIRERFRNFGVEFKLDAQVFLPEPEIETPSEPIDPTVKEDVPPEDKSDKKVGKRAKKG